MEIFLVAKFTCSYDGGNLYMMKFGVKKHS